MTCEQRTPVRWTEEEDRILRREVFRTGVKEWNHIATKLSGRTNKDCRKRWTKIAENVNKGTWSAAEDKRLKQAVAKFGMRWAAVASVMQTRHADQCSKRWYHYLDPSLDHREWNDMDDAQLIEAVGQHGRKWATIREVIFPGRSTTDIKNRHVILERRARQALEGGSEASMPDLHDQSIRSGASSCSNTGTPNSPEMFNIPSTPDPEPSIQPWTAYSSRDVVMGEEHFGMTPDVLIVNDGHKHLVSPWQSSTASMCSSIADSWSYGQCQATAEGHLDPLLQNAIYPFDRMRDWSSIESADMCQAPKGTPFSPSSTMILEDLEPDIINKVISVLIESKGSVKMQLF